MKYHSLLIIVALAASIIGCSSPDTQVIYHQRNSEAGRQIADLDAIAKASQDTKFQDKARRTAIEFISHAGAGNVAQMMNLTSPATLEQTGKDRVKLVYAEQVIPQFRGASITWNPGGKPLATGGYPGYEVSGVARRDKAFPFYVYVFQEHGRFVVGTLKKTPQP